MLWDDDIAVGPSPSWCSIWTQPEPIAAFCSIGAFYASYYILEAALATPIGSQFCGHAVSWPCFFLSAAIMCKPSIQTCSPCLPLKPPRGTRLKRWYRQAMASRIHCSIKNVAVLTYIITCMLTIIYRPVSMSRHSSSRCQEPALRPSTSCWATPQPKPGIKAKILPSS
jgi:hypothetical protein